MRKWVFRDKAFIESGRGNLTLTLPATFSGDVDLWSLSGNAGIAFPLVRNVSGAFVGPEPANRISGRVGRGGELLRLYSEFGDVRVLKRADR
jgi:hypothetical protein